MQPSLRRRLGQRAFNAAALACVAVSAWIAAPLLTPSDLRLETVYVSPAGSYWNSGRFPAEPVGTIAEALRRVRRSGTILLLDGAYAERVHIRQGGTPEKRLLIAAQNPGRTTLTWKNPAGIPRESEWQDEGDGIFSTDIAWPLYWIRSGDESLLRLSFGSVDTLRRLAHRSRRFGAFIQIGSRLYVSLADGRNPAEADFETHQEVPAPAEWGQHNSANLWVEADHVELRGLNFEFGIGAGVRLWNAENVLIDDCAFSMATHGVRGRRKRQPTHISVRNCVYQNYPQGLWLDDWLTWKEVYGWLSGNGLTTSAGGESFSISNCVSAHCADGLRVSPVRYVSDVTESVVEKNWVAFTSDDGIECDGDSKNLRVEQNLLLDCYVGLSSSPSRIGPLQVERNIAWTETESSRGAHLKFLNPWKNAAGELDPTQNVLLKENLFVGGRTIFWSDQVPLMNCHAEDSIFLTSSDDTTPWPPDMTMKRLHRESLGRREIPDPVGIFEKVVGAKMWDAARYRRLVDGIHDRPGPHWWPLEQHPATSRLVEFVKELKRSQP